VKDERSIGGLACSEVLARLDSFVDGTLTADEREHMTAHVAGCDRCERFGGTYAAVVQRIRATARSEPPDPAVLERLTNQLANLGSA